MNNIWIELSEENRRKVIESYKDMINDKLDERAICLMEELFGKENLKPQIKTWEDVVKSGYNIKDDFKILEDGSGDFCIWYDGLKTDPKVVKKVIATFKIAKLIELGYGGMITEAEWKSGREKYTINLQCDNGSPVLEKGTTCYYAKLLAFHTPEQRNDFLKYNEQLCKDYYMV